MKLKNYSLVKIHSVSNSLLHNPAYRAFQKGEKDRVYKVLYPNYNAVSYTCVLWDVVGFKRKGVHYYDLYPKTVVPYDFNLGGGVEQWL